MDAGLDTAKLQSADPVDDPAFVALLRAGDPAAFERLVRETTGRMLVVARRFLPHEEDAHDALQDAYISAFRGLPRFDGHSRVTTWLHRVVVNASLMKLRSRRRRPETRLEDLAPHFDAAGHHESMPRHWQEAPPSGAERQEVLRDVRQAIHELPDDFRDVILLRDIEEIDTRTASAMLGISESALKTRLHRARLALRGVLDARLSRGAGTTPRKGLSSLVSRRNTPGPDHSSSAKNLPGGDAP